MNSEWKVYLAFCAVIIIEALLILFAAPLEAGL